jgi:hypothetical protein
MEAVQSSNTALNLRLHDHTQEDGIFMVTAVRIQILHVK